MIPKKLTWAAYNDGALADSIFGQYCAFTNKSCCLHNGTMFIWSSLPGGTIEKAKKMCQRDYASRLRKHIKQHQKT